MASLTYMIHAMSQILVYREGCHLNLKKIIYALSYYVNSEINVFIKVKYENGSNRKIGSFLSTTVNYTDTLLP